MLHDPSPKVVILGLDGGCIGIMENGNDYNGLYWDYTLQALKPNS